MFCRVVTGVKHTEGICTKSAFFPDLTLAKTIEKRAELEGATTWSRAVQHEKVLTRYVEVANTMHDKGLIPFVHGQAALWLIPQNVLRFMGLSPYRSYQLHISKRVAMSNWELQHYIKEEIKERNTQWFPPRDITTLFENLYHFEGRLLPVTIGLFHCENKKSPLSFVFGGTMPQGIRSIPCEYPGNTSRIPFSECKILANQMIQHTLVESTGTYGKIDEILFTDLESLYQEAKRASIGQLMVIGVPQNSLSTHIYHCETEGIPTNIPIQFILQKLAEGTLPEGGCQARLLICRESLSKDSGIEVINLMDGSAVQKFCAGTSDSVATRELKEVLHSIFQQRIRCPGDTERYAAIEAKHLEEHNILREKLNSYFGAKILPQCPWVRNRFSWC